jgi:hypothetical protein
MAQAEVWRSQTIHLFNAKRDSSESITPMAQDTQRMTHSLAVKLSHHFLTSPAHHLLCESKHPDISARQDRQLLKLFYKAAGLSTALWTQQTSMNCNFHLMGRPFSAISAYVTAHRLYQVEDDETYLNEKPIVVAVSPVILAYGNENKEDYHQHKVWKRQLS